jgi:hypothetical protein
VGTFFACWDRLRFAAPESVVSGAGLTEKEGFEPSRQEFTHLTP